MRNPQRHALRRPHVGPFPKLSEIRPFFLEMGLHEAYAGRGVAIFAYEALKDTHTEHPAALGSNRG